MSYATLNDRSNVYVLKSASSGQLECIGCALATSSSIVRCETPAHMMAHLEEHRKHGQMVPRAAIARLTREMLDSWQIPASALSVGG